MIRRRRLCKFQTYTVSDDDDDDAAYRVSGSLSSPKVDVAVDMGNPFLNLALDGFLKIGSIAAARVAAEDAYDVVRRGKISSHNFEHTLKKMCKEGAYWGTVAGLYVGMEYGVENVRGRRDWKNAMIGGALTGAVISAATNNNRDKIVADTITGAAIATAAEFSQLSHLTFFFFVFFNFPCL